VRRLAVGVMTEVLIARSAEPNVGSRLAAVKCVARGCVGEPPVESLFAREATLASRLSHPNVVSVLEVCRDRDRLCLVMEYMDGPTLALLVRTGPLPADVAIHVARELLAGLGYLHAARLPGRRFGLAHCDIAPENVLLSLAGAVKIADFGAARELSGPDTGPRVLKTATASYVSPEQLNEQRVDGRSDLFAVGAVLWELLVGEPLFEDMSPGEVAARINFRTLPRLGSVRPGTAHELEDVVARLLSREPDARYRTAAEASADLARCAATHTGERDLARLIEEQTRPEGDRERGHRVASSHTSPMPPMPLVRRSVLLDLPGREPSTFSDAEYHALLEALQRRSPPWNRSRDLALVHVLYHCKLGIDTAVGLDIGQLHLEKGVFLDVVLPRAREPRQVRFNHLVREALELWVLHRRSHIRGNGSSALFLWDYDARLPAAVARMIMQCGPRR
jgi:serine/threonine protein kinase